MAKQVTDLSAAILALLKGRAAGMEVEPIIETLKSRDGEVSPRGVRNLLNRMADENRLVRRKKKGSGRGTPPFVFYHPDAAPRERTLFDDAIDGPAARLQSRDDTEQDALETEEKSRLERARSVLANIAKGHLNEERYARAIIEAAPKIAEEDPVELLIEDGKVGLWKTSTRLPTRSAISGGGT